MRAKTTLTTKLLATGCGFLLLALTSIGLTLWITWKLEGGAAAVNEAGRLRMLTVRMALAIQTNGPDELRVLAQRFDASLELLRTGDSSRPLFVPWSDDARGHFAEINDDWQLTRVQWLGATLPPAAEADVGGRS